MPPARQVPWRMKYRPGSFDEFVDQDEIKTVLRRALESNQLDNWLFTGAPGLGKTALARLFIREYAKRWGLVNAKGDPGEAFFKVAELTTDTANVQTVSDLSRFAKFLLSREAEEKGAFRIIVLDEIDRFSGKAMEDLRSLLEGQGQWAGRAIVIATTNYPDKVPAAVRSRFREFKFHDPPLEAMVRRLKDVAAAEGCTVTDADVTAIARDAEGSLRQGLVLLQEKCMGSLPPGEIPSGDLRSPVEEQERADSALLAMLEFPVRVPTEAEMESILALVRRRSGVKEAKTYTYRGMRYNADRLKALLAGAAQRKSNLSRMAQETVAMGVESLPPGTLGFFGAMPEPSAPRPAPVGERTPPTLKAQGALPATSKATPPVIGYTKAGVVDSGQVPDLPGPRRLVYTPWGRGHIAGEDADHYYVLRIAGAAVEVHKHRKDYIDRLQQYYAVGSTVDTYWGPAVITESPVFVQDIGMLRGEARLASGEVRTFVRHQLKDFPVEGGEPTAPSIPTQSVHWTAFVGGSATMGAPPPPAVPVPPTPRSFDTMDEARAYVVREGYTHAVEPPGGVRFYRPTAGSPGQWDVLDLTWITTRFGSHLMVARHQPLSKLPPGAGPFEGAKPAAAPPPPPAAPPSAPPFPWPEWRWPVPWPHGSEKDHSPREFRDGRMAFDLAEQDFWLPLMIKALGHAPQAVPDNPIGLIVSGEDWAFLRTRLFRDSSAPPVWATDIGPLGSQVEVMVPGHLKDLVRAELVRRLGREPFVKFARWIIRVEDDWPKVRDLFLPWPAIVQQRHLSVPDPPMASVAPVESASPPVDFRAQLADAFEKYDGTGEIETVQDLADVVEGLAADNPGPVADLLLAAVESYRAELEEDFRKYAGRGDPDAYEGAFLDAVRTALPPPVPPTSAPAVAPPPKKEPWEMTQEEIAALPSTAGLYERLVEMGHTIPLRLFIRTAERIEIRRGTPLPARVAFEDAVREIAARVGITQQQAASVLTHQPEEGPVGGFVHGSAVPGVIHTLIVARAVSEGKTVPGEVLADYPSLRPKVMDLRLPGAPPPPGVVLPVVEVPTAAAPEPSPARFRPGDFVLRGARILHVRSVEWDGKDWTYTGTLNGTPDFRISQRDLVAGLPGAPAQPHEASAVGEEAPPPAETVSEVEPEDQEGVLPQEAAELVGPEELALPPDVDSLPRAVKDSLTRAGYRLEDVHVVVPGAGFFVLVLRDRWGGTANVQIGEGGSITAAFAVSGETPYHKRGHEPPPTPAPRVELGLPPLRPAQKEMVGVALVKKVGMIVAPTGTGKTITALGIWERLGRPRMLWATPTRFLLEQVVRERFPNVGIDPTSIGVWYGDEKRPGPITVAIYDTLAIDPSFIARDWPLIVLDEADVLQDPSFVQKILPALKAAHERGSVVIGLTATPPKRALAGAVREALPPIYELEHERARAEGLVAPVDVVWVKASFSPTEEGEYRTAQKAVSTASHSIPGGPPKWAQFAKGTDARARVARAGLKGLSERDRLVSGADEKLDLAVGIVQDTPGERVMAFALRVDAIEELCGRLHKEKIGCAAVSADTPRDERLRILGAWGRDFQVLSSVHVLERGIDVPEARVALFLSGRATSLSPGKPGRGRPSKVSETDLREIIQRVGRILRPKEGKRAELHVLYIPGTVDDKMVRGVVEYTGARPPAGVVVGPAPEVQAEGREAQGGEEEALPSAGPAPVGVAAAALPGSPPASPPPPPTPLERYGNFVVTPRRDAFVVVDDLGGVAARPPLGDKGKARELAKTLADMREHGFQSGELALRFEATGQRAGGFTLFRARTTPLPGPPPAPKAPPTPLPTPSTYGDFQVRQFSGKWRIWDEANEQWSGGVPPDVDGPPIRAPITPHVQEANSVALLLAEHRLDRATRDPLFSTFFEPAGKSLGGFMTYQRPEMEAFAEAPAATATPQAGTPASFDALNEAWAYVVREGYTRMRRTEFGFVFARPVAGEPLLWDELYITRMGGGGGYYMVRGPSREVVWVPPSPPPSDGYFVSGPVRGTAANMLDVTAPLTGAPPTAPAAPLIPALAPLAVAPAARAEAVVALAPPKPVVAPAAPAGPLRPSLSTAVTPERPLGPTPQLGNYAVLQVGATWMVQDLLTNHTVGFLPTEEEARNQAAALASVREQQYATDPLLRAMAVPTGESPGGHRAFRFGR